MQNKHSFCGHCILQVYTKSGKSHFSDILCSEYIRVLTFENVFLLHSILQLKKPVALLSHL